MAATDARHVPKRGEAFRFYFHIRKADGSLVTGWTGADTELSIDANTPADATNEAIEIGSSGQGYIDITGDELDCYHLGGKVHVTNTDALDVIFDLYPSENSLEDLATSVVLEEVASAVISDGVLLATQTIDDIVDAMTQVARFAYHGPITDAGTNFVVIDDAHGASLEDDSYVRMVLMVTRGTGAGQMERVSGYVAASNTVTIAKAFAVVPVVGSSEVVLIGL